MKKYVVRLSGLLLVILGIFSCTYDYFEDENNFRIYVPQMKEGSITSFYVAIHDMNGKHVTTRRVDAPFDKDELMKEGILRFKLNGWQNYHLTCFTDFTPQSITEGNVFEDSYKAKTVSGKGNWLSDYGDDTYTSRHNNPKMLLTEVAAFPMGHPDGAEPVTIDMNNKQCFKGMVDIEFQDLPTGITRIDILYQGLATKIMFDGNYTRFHDDDRILAIYDDLSGFRQGNKLTLPTDILNASSGVFFEHTDVGRSGGGGNDQEKASVATKAATRAPNAEPLELELRFYNASGSSVGTALFTENDFLSLADSKKPTDGNGNPLQSLVLNPRETIKFIFKEFLVVSIELVGWGDPDPGEVTPM